VTRRLLIIAIAAWLLPAVSASADSLLIIANSTVNVATPLPLSEIAAIYLLRVTT
jgi:hypothetical protein